MKGKVVTGECIRLKAVKLLLRLGGLLPRRGIFLDLKALRYTDLLIRMVPVP